MTAAGPCSARLGLLAERLADLQQRAIRAGLEVTGSKAALVERYVAAARAACRAAGAPTDPSTTILSIDVGLRNLAYAYCGADGRIHDWRRIAVFDDGSGAHDVAKSAAAARALVRQLPRADLVVIEQQRHRSQGSKTIAETVFRGAVLEAQLHALLPGAVPVGPAKVARFCGFPAGREKKAAAVRLATCLLEAAAADDGTSAAATDDGRGGARPRRRRAPLATAWTPPSLDAWTVRPRAVPATLLAMFHAEPKQDDLSDCLLQALAVLNWRAHLRSAGAALDLPCTARGAPCCCDGVRPLSET